MPELFGASYRRADLLRRIGRLEQVAGIRLVTLGDAQGRGVRVLEFRTGTGFTFDVLVDRGFDVGRCELGGRPLSWLSGAGVVAPWYYEPDGWGWFRAWGGGMVVTCGLDHTLGPAREARSYGEQAHRDRGGLSRPGSTGGILGRRSWLPRGVDRGGADRDRGLGGGTARPGRAGAAGTRGAGAGVRDRSRRQDRQEPPAPGHQAGRLLI